MTIRTMAKILGISPAYLSLLINGKRQWRGDLKERYETLVSTFVNKKENQLNIKSIKNKEIVTNNDDGGAGENRTRYLFNAIEALSQMSYSPKSK